MKILGIHIRKDFLFLCAIEGNHSSFRTCNIDPKERIDNPSISFTSSNKSAIKDFYNELKAIIVALHVDRIALRKISLIAPSTKDIASKSQIEGIISLIAGQINIPCEEVSMGNVRNFVGAKGKGHFDENIDSQYKSMCEDIKYWSAGVNQAFAAARVLLK